MDFLQAISQLTDTTKKVVELSVYLVDLLRKHFAPADRRQAVELKAKLSRNFTTERVAEFYSAALASKKRFTCLDLWVNIEFMLQQREFMVVGLETLLTSKLSDPKKVRNACEELRVCTETLISMVDGFYQILTGLDDPQFRRIEPDIHKMMVATRIAGGFLLESIIRPVLRNERGEDQSIARILETPSAREKLVELCNSLKKMVEYLAETDVVKTA